MRKTSRHRFVLSILVLLVWAISPPVLRAVPDTAVDDDKRTYPSPNERFIFHRVDDSRYGVTKANSEEAVPFPEDAQTIQPVENTIDCLWARDSKHFAVNARVGGRYDATELFAWDGEKFVLMPSFDDLIGARLDATRKAEIRRRKIPSKTNLRRIWDTYRTISWINSKTLKVLAYSSKVYTLGDSNEMNDLIVAWLFTIKYDSHNHPHIIALKKPSKAMMDQN